MNLKNNNDFLASISNVLLLSNDIKNIIKSPSPLGIEKDIISLLQKYSISIEQYFSLIQQILSKKSSRSTEENYLISGYLILMKDFTNLISKNSDKNSSETNQDLTLISNKLGYEKWNENMILMRMGEKGKKAYIMLNGNIDILIKNVNVYELNEYEYLYYLTNLIRFKEFGLLNFVVNDNFTVYPLVIVDDLEEMKKKSFKGKNEMEKNILDEIDEKEDDHNNNENNNENNENNNNNNNENNNNNNENNNNNDNNTEIIIQDNNNKIVSDETDELIKKFKEFLENLYNKCYELLLMNSKIDFTRSMAETGNLNVNKEVRKKTRKITRKQMKEMKEKNENKLKEIEFDKDDIDDERMRTFYKNEKRKNNAPSSDIFQRFMEEQQEKVREFVYKPETKKNKP